MPISRALLTGTLLLAAAHTAWAQAPDLPAESPFQRQGIYTTKDTPPAAQQPLPWLKATPNPPPAPVTAPPSQPSYPAGYMPFKKAQPMGAVPGMPALPMNQAAPVDDIGAIEVTEPAAPAVMEPGANPAAEDPSAPTELTAPIFDAAKDDKAPRTIVLNVLNKVTAQSDQLKLKPGEETESGRITIKAEQCYRSLEGSLPDSVALVRIREIPPGAKDPKTLFYGWMYASSPSIAALEHPIYDVTLVDCAKQAPKPADAADKKKDQKSKN